MSNYQRIFLHCSDSEWGYALLIDKWHRERGWNGCGYGECILNGYPTADWFNKKIKIPYLEGSVEIGRVISSGKIFIPSEIQAGVQGYNTNSHHICMIGKNYFSDKVLNSTLTVIQYRLQQFNLTPNDVLGHYEKDPAKTCPNIDMKEFRQHLIDNTNYGQKIINIGNNINNGNNHKFSKILNLFSNLFNAKGLKYAKT